jgi:hypothetical protein
MHVKNQRNASTAMGKDIELLNAKNLLDQENVKIVVRLDIKLMFVKIQQNQKFASIAEKKVIPPIFVHFHRNLVATARVKNIDTGIALSQRNQWLATTAGRSVMVKANVLYHLIAEIVYNQVMSKRIVKMIMLIHLAWYADQKNILPENVQTNQRNVSTVTKKVMRKLTVQNPQKIVVDLLWHASTVKEKDMGRETAQNQERKEKDLRWLATIAKVKDMEQEIVRNQRKKEHQVRMVDTKGKGFNEYHMKIIKQQFLNFEKAQRSPYQKHNDWMFLYILEFKTQFLNIKLLYAPEFI